MTGETMDSTTNKQPTRRALLLTMLGAPLVSGLGASSRAYAASPWPQERPVTLVVPSGPGSIPDQLARIFARLLAADLGQQFLVDPRPGAAGIIGANVVAMAKPDGYSLLYTAAALASAPATMAKMPYDPVNAFTPIAQVLRGPLLLIANPKIGPANMEGLLSAAAAKPGSISYGHFGTGSPAHIVMEMMSRDKGVKLVDVPYKSVPLSIQDLLGGTIPVAVVDPFSAAAHVKAGTVVPLAVTGASRLDILPGVRSFGELKLRTDLTGWHGVFGPANLPPAITERLNAAFAKAATDREVVSTISNAGCVPVQPPQSSKEWGDHFRAELALWEQAARTVGLPKQ